MITNALALAWSARCRLWAKEIDEKGNLGRLANLSREEMDSHISAIIFAIEEERQERNLEKIYQLLEEHGLIEKAVTLLEKG